MRRILRTVIASWVPNGQSPFGRVLRWPLRAIPKEAVLPILTGPNRGFRWIAEASVHGCWIGSYERVIADQLWSALSPGDVFYDIGANVGYYTLLGSRAVGPDGCVIAFEPLPRNVLYLKRHIAINGITNVDVIEAAIVQHDGTVAISSDGGPSLTKISPGGSLTVSGRALDSLALPPPDVVKMDVEGAEAEVLRGALETLRKYRPLLIFSTHSRSLRVECREIVRSIGYNVVSISRGGSDHVAEPGQ